MKRHGKQKGFVLITIIPFLSLMILGFSGLFFMGWGIKNFTKSQTACIKANLKGQEALGYLLIKLLDLNQSSKSLNGKRKAIQRAMATALGSGNFQAFAFLKKTLEIVKLRQKLLMIQQKMLIAKSRKEKRAAIRNFQLSLARLKTKSVYELTAFKKALAVQKKQIGKDAYVYTPVKEFSKAQRTIFLWHLNPLAQAAGMFNIFSSEYYGKYSCSATLKRNGKIWKAGLSL